MKDKKTFLTVAGSLVAAVALGQSYSIDWHSIDGGGGTSTGGVYSVSGTIGQLDANQQPMTGGSFSLAGGFWSLFAEPTPGSTTIFDNTNGTVNGLTFASTTSWLAGKFCLGSDGYTLDSVTLFLNSGDGSGQAHESTVRLQIYSHDPVTGKPSAGTGPIMNLSGTTNPITLAAGNASTAFTWTPETPFSLSANGCYWAVLSVDSGAIAWQGSTFSMPTGAAGSFGRSSSSNGGATWTAVDASSNYKMLIMGTPSATPPPLTITAVSFFGTELRFTFPALFGHSYVIESRADLATGEWTEVPGTTQTGAGASHEISLPISASEPQRFYRVKQFP